MAFKFIIILEHIERLITKMKDIKNIERLPLEKFYFDLILLLSGKISLFYVTIVNCGFFTKVTWILVFQLLSRYLYH